MSRHATLAGWHPATVAHGHRCQVSSALMADKVAITHI